MLHTFFVHFYKSFATLLPLFPACLLFFTGFVLSRRIHLPKLLSPKRFFAVLRDIPAHADTTPQKAVSMALAGTLGVGNITGVAAAVCQGGVGAVFWMWIGSLFSMAVKYGEVALAVRYRKQDGDGRHYGGMMYVIRDGLSARVSPKTAGKMGGIFAMLCLVNALVTGNLVQSRAAAVVLPMPTPITGILLCLAVGLAMVYGVGRVGDITLRLVPAMTILYSGLSLWILFGNLSLLPCIFGEIVTSAFSLEAIGGGTIGIGLREVLTRFGDTGCGRAMRYGVLRGIFSNEAGCGTSPTAHASAVTKSPHHQGMYGIFEVICDTPLLCTMTALVLCVADKRYGILSYGGDGLTLAAYGAFGGQMVRSIMAVMVVLFAYATILAQLYYGKIAICYFTENGIFVKLYCMVTVGMVFVGSVLGSGVIWGIADLVISVMTVITTTVLLILRREIGEMVPFGKKKKGSPGCESFLKCFLK